MKKRFLGLDWKEHLLYILLLLAVGWFFNRKTTEQARLHDTMEAVFPVAAQAISYMHLMERIHQNADYYRSERRETYRTRAMAIRTWVESTGAALERIAGMQDVKDQRKELAPVLEQLVHLPDSILLVCDSDSAIGQQLRKILPDEIWSIAAEYLPKAEQPELARLANALRIRMDLAVNAGLRYIFLQVKEDEIQYAYLPVLTMHQPCPSVGELFEVEIHLDRYFTERDFEIMINGRRYVSDRGLVHFAQRFERPGKHKIRVHRELPWGGDEDEFEVEVQPR